MSEPYLISIDHLRNGETQKFTMKLPAAFLEVDEPELKFSEEVRVGGEAYLVEENLVLRFDAETRLQMPCAVCNQQVLIPLSIKTVYHTIALDLCASSLFDVRPALREELLIELPKTVECEENCPERRNVARFMRSEQKEEPSQYFPFSDLK